MSSVGECLAVFFYWFHILFWCLSEDFSLFVFCVFFVWRDLSNKHVFFDDWFHRCHFARRISGFGWYFRICLEGAHCLGDVWEYGFGWYFRISWWFWILQLFGGTHCFFLGRGIEPAQNEHDTCTSQQKTYCRNWDLGILSWGHWRNVRHWKFNVKLW